MAMSRLSIFTNSSRVMKIASLVLLLATISMGFYTSKWRLKLSPHLSATVEKTESEWRKELSEDQFYVLRQDGTERSNSSPLNRVKQPGTFLCAGCNAPLFQTKTKFDSGTGWPSFFDPIDDKAVLLNVDYKALLPRTECRCAVCNGHLGHVFPDGPKPTGQRYCMNGVAMKFETHEGHSELATEVATRVANAKPMVVPATSPLPQIIFNSGLAFAFLSSFYSRVATGGAQLEISQILPLAAGLYYLTLSTQGLLQINSNDS